MLSRFHLIPEHYGQTDGLTDGQTDRIAISISRVSVLTRDKNCDFFQKLSNLELYCLLTTYRNSYIGFSKNTLLDP